MDNTVMAILGLVLLGAAVLTALWCLSMRVGLREIRDLTQMEEEAANRRVAEAKRTGDMMEYTAAVAEQDLANRINHAVQNLL